MICGMKTGWITDNFTKQISAAVYCITLTYFKCRQLEPSLEIPSM